MRRIRFIYVNGEEEWYNLAEPLLPTCYIDEPIKPNLYAMSYSISPNRLKPIRHYFHLRETIGCELVYLEGYK